VPNPLSTTIARERPQLRALARVDRSRLAVAAALPGAIGYAIPLAAGLASGHLSDGVTASVGALIVGFANLGGRYRLRSATLLATTLAAGLAALLGGLAGPSTAATVVVMAGWGFAGGLLVCLGTRAAFVGLLSTWAMLLAGDLYLHGDAVLRVAWLITAGGLVQTLVAIAAWPLRPFAAEQRAVADAFRALADYARAPTAAGPHTTSAALAAASATIGVGSTAPERLQALVEHGEWLRVRLVALTRLDVAGVDEALTVAADALEAVAGGRDPAPSIARLHRRARMIADLAARDQVASLTVRIVAAAADQDDDITLGGGQHRDVIRLLRAELTLRSPAFRHALRLSLALIVAVLVYRALDLTYGYWVPLTVLFVLRPDYGTTVGRGIARIVGTMTGITVAWALVTVFSPSNATIVVLLALLAAVGYALFPANYALFSVALTILIALVVEFSGGSPSGALIDRLLDTAIGGAIALGAFALWPTREAPRTQEELARYVIAQGRWLHAIVGSYWDEDARRSLRSERLATRRARTQAQDAVRRVLAEPPRRRLASEPLEALLEAMDQINVSALVLAVAVHDGARAAGERLGRYRDELDSTFDVLARSLRDGARMPDGPPREEMLALDGTDPTIAALAGEARSILAALERIEATWSELVPSPLIGDTLPDSAGTPRPGAIP
jgi:uncharacterized membrane protein YccC